MKWYQRMAAWVALRAAKLAGSHLRDPGLLALFSLDNIAASGQHVDENTALNCSAFFAGVRLISESIGMLPLHVYQRVNEKARMRAPAHPVYRLLHDEPNPMMTPISAFSAMQAHAMTTGNGYAFIERNGAGVPIGLWPIAPSTMSPEVRGTRKVYIERLSSGQTATHSDLDILHIPGLGYDGLSGYSILQLARETLGYALAADEYAGKQFGENILPGGVLEHPGHLGAKAQQALRESIEQRHAGTTRAGRLMILEEGMKFSKYAFSPADSQLLESRKFSVVEISRWLNVPPHLLRDLDHATFSNIEHQGIDFVTYSLMPWLVRWQQEISRKLFRADERDSFFVEFLVDALQRGDLGSRMTAYNLGRNMGTLTANDILAKENMNPLPEAIGDTVWVPLNMQLVGPQGPVTFGGPKDGNPVPVV